MQLAEIKNFKDVPRGYDGKPLRGLKKEIALRAKADRIKGPEPKIKDEMIGAAKVVKEEALDTKKAEDLWAENESSAAEYTPNTTYLVRKKKDSGEEPEYEVFAVKGASRKAYGTFTPSELQAALTPIRANQTPDAEGFTTYLEKDKTEAIQYDGEPIKVLLGQTGARLMKGDYLIRSNNGNDFEYSTETGPNFEATMQKV